MNWTQQLPARGKSGRIGVDRRGSCRRIAWPARVFQTAGISGGVNGAAGFNAGGRFRLWHAHQTRVDGRFQWGRLRIVPDRLDRALRHLCLRHNRSTGQFEIVKQSVAGLADDRRIQAILIAFSFGAFIEGAAGLEPPVAISAAMLIGLGFKTTSGRGYRTHCNTAPVAFGALGTPITALATVTNIPAETLGRNGWPPITIFSLIIPFC